MHRELMNRAETYPMRSMERRREDAVYFDDRMVVVGRPGWAKGEWPGCAMLTTGVERDREMLKSLALPIHRRPAEVQARSWINPSISTMKAEERSILQYFLSPHSLHASYFESLSRDPRLDME
jgi:hypothetical protein